MMITRHGGYDGMPVPQYHGVTAKVEQVFRNSSGFIAKEELKMNITIENKELQINTVNELMEAQSKLLEAFAESLIGTRESIKEEVRKEVEEEVKQELEQNLLNSAGMGSIDELYGWLDEMNACNYVGLSDDEIADKVMKNALSHTDYDSVEEMEDRITDMERAFSNIYDEISDFI